MEEKCITCGTMTLCGKIIQFYKCYSNRKCERASATVSTRVQGKNANFCVPTSCDYALQKQHFLVQCPHHFKRASASIWVQGKNHEVFVLPPPVIMSCKNNIFSYLKREKPCSLAIASASAQA